MGELGAYAALLVMAVLPIVAGAHMSLKMPREARKRLRAHRRLARQREGAKAQEEEAEGESDEEEEDDEDPVERLTTADALVFPILGSCMLCSLFLLFKYLPKIWINRILGGYMSIIGVAATARVAVATVQLCVPERRWKGLPMWKLSLQKQTGKDKTELVSPRGNIVHLLAIVLAVALAVSQHYRPHWIVMNLLALSFAFNAISLLRLDSFFTGSILLALLFIYDIWWVFGSKAVFGPGADVMVKVATNLEAPIKITFPRDLASGTGFSLLGLGDIVLPGIYVALALRYDYHRAVKANPPPKPSSAFARPYFLTVLVAYIGGLVTTVWVMHTFKAAQPALLYLSPACISAVVLCALVRGELVDFWAFDDASDDDERASNKKEDSNPEERDGDGKEGAAERESVAESTSVEVEGQRVLRSRVVKQ